MVPDRGPGGKRLSPQENVSEHHTHSVPTGLTQIRKSDNEGLKGCGSTDSFLILCLSRGKLV